jgi:hypothetical protein
MPRKSMVLAAIVFAAILPAAAGQGRQEGASTDQPKAHGTVTSWDPGSHTFRVKTHDGTESVFHWNERTQMRGEPKVGETIKLEFHKDASGNAMATRIAVKDKEAREATGERRSHEPSLSKS